MQSQPSGPTRPLGYHPISIWNSLLDSHRTVEVQMRLGINPSIVEVTSTRMISSSRLLALLSAEYSKGGGLRDAVRQ